MKNIFSNKISKGIIFGGFPVIAIGGSLFAIYVYSPGFVPEVIVSGTKALVDKVVGKTLSEKIDAVRDEDGATSIRLIFNDKKEENLEKHCEKKEEKGKQQEKCYKTYENEEFGYSLQYPEGWTKRDDRTIFIDQEFLSSQGETDYIEIAVYKNDSNLSTNDWINANKSIFIGDQEMNEVDGFNNRTQVIIDKVPAIQLVWNNMGEIKSTVINFDSKIYVIDISTLSNFSSNTEMESIGNALLNSFKLK